MKRCRESELALISVIFSFLLRLSEVKYHWSKSGKGKKTVNLLCFMRSTLTLLMIQFLLLIRTSSKGKATRNKASASKIREGMWENQTVLGGAYMYISIRRIENSCLGKESNNVNTGLFHGENDLVTTT